MGEPRGVKNAMGALGELTRKMSRSDNNSNLVSRSGSRRDDIASSPTRRASNSATVPGKLAATKEAVAQWTSPGSSRSSPRAAGDAQQPQHHQQMHAKHFSSGARRAGKNSSGLWNSSGANSEKITRGSSSSQLELGRRSKERSSQARKTSMTEDYANTSGGPQKSRVNANDNADVPSSFRQLLPSNHKAGKDKAQTLTRGMSVRDRMFKSRTTELESSQDSGLLGSHEEDPVLAALESDGTPSYHIYVERNGWLRKQTKRLRTRRKCFVKLMGSRLAAYHDDQDAVPSWELDIRCAKISGSSKLLTIEITQSAKHVMLYAADAKDWNDWQRALRAASVSHIEDQYQLGELIGQGTYGQVRSAVRRRDNKLCAVKIIERGLNDKELELMKREMDVMRSVDHPSIVRTFDVFDTADTIYIAMEYVGGGDLFQVISELGEAAAFSEWDASLVMREVLQGLEYLHSQNIVHRDIKPENILCVDRTFPLKVKLTDFGFAGLLLAGTAGDGQIEEHQKLNTLIGTPFYTAPEILRNEGHGPAVDLYACGVVLYAMLCGSLPYENGDEDEYVSAAQGQIGWDRLVDGVIEFPDKYWRNVSAEAKDFVRSLLSLNPKDRPSAKAAQEHAWFKMDPSKVALERAETSKLSHDLQRLKRLTSSSRMSTGDLRASDSLSKQNSGASHVRGSSFCLVPTSPNSIHRGLSSTSPSSMQGTMTAELIDLTLDEVSVAERSMAVSSPTSTRSRASC
ncbi:Calcium/calmodulin-dependent protein kinase [Porphyridium purpureum]|uniref:Calcium/calmodulin-dependent protein kinase n=1 Tax=Porphyridium purpureum TaxID=35688 RepID=A0A5J4YN65_PORPP|nr:Calcium/calmodulin-dependent protein kinase [Porphyridium purpureum]|eukprot:POR2990..scf295_9